MSRRESRVAAYLLLAMVALSGVSCAYYNTFYLARKYYHQGTEGRPYIVSPEQSQQQQQQQQQQFSQPQQAVNSGAFKKSIDYSKKLISNYPKSKWVDDAYLLWARSLLATDDPGQTVNMLEEFPTQFPNSPLLAEAKFYLGLAHLRTRKYELAIRAFDEFLKDKPRHDLAPYAHLEKSRALMSLERPGEAAEAAGAVLIGFDKDEEHGLRVDAQAARARARLAQGEYDLALADYRELGQRSRTDEERFDYLLLEADCHEAARRYAEELALLRDALAHEREPVLSDTTRGRPAMVQQVAGFDRYGRLLIRIGTVHMLAGRDEEALDAYHRVANRYPGVALAGEAQYRIGYVYETQLDDFEKARAAYAEVQRHAGSTLYGEQARSRLANLERLAQFRSAAGDSVQKKSEEAFMLAEIYLFQQDKPERALEEYRKIEQDFDGTPTAGKALNAQAWVLSRRLDREAEAESLMWRVIRDYPATEAQLAARDYLEQAGHLVPASLIKLPERKPTPVDSAAIRRLLAPLEPPDESSALDEARRGGLFAPTPGVPRLPIAGAPDSLALRSRADSLRLGLPPISLPADSARVPLGLHPDSTRAPAPRDTTARGTGAPPAADSTRTPAPADTTGSRE